MFDIREKATNEHINHFGLNEQTGLWFVDSVGVGKEVTLRGTLLSGWKE